VASDEESNSSQVPTGADQVGGPAIAELHATLRALHDVVSSTNPPDEVVSRDANQLTEAVSLLEPFTVSEAEAIAGKRPDSPGRGSPLLLPVVIEEETEISIGSSVRFTPSTPAPRCRSRRLDPVALRRGAWLARQRRRYHSHGVPPRELPEDHTHQS
jgi:hypothetical protein